LKSESIGTLPTGDPIAELILDYGRDDYYAARGYGYGNSSYGRSGYYPPGNYVPPGYVQAPAPPPIFGGLFGGQQYYYQQQQQQPAPRVRRVDPDYFFGRRQYY